MEIKILGPGCRNCEKLAEETKRAAKEAGCTVNISKVTDMKEIMSYGVLSTPGLVINGKVKSYGRIPSAGEIRKWVDESLAENK
ncbi:MAG TPA: thioredoxin family protein [Syntrophales bacterium]|nr:thioredoxin family protein [Syntrophales bacterium]